MCEEDEKTTTMTLRHKTLKQLHWEMEIGALYNQETFLKTILKKVD